MKKRLFFLLAACALAATSCSTEEQFAADPGTSGGAAAATGEGNLTLLLRTESLDDGTRAYTRAEVQKEEEKKVAKLNVYVFDATTGLLEVQKEFTPKNNETTLTKVTLPVAVGKKRIAVVANYATAPSLVIGSTSDEEFWKRIEEFSYTNDDNGGKNGMLLNNGNFLMSGHTTQDVEVTSGEEAEAPIQLVRFAAKVTLQAGSANPAEGNFGTPTFDKTADLKFTLEVKGFKRGNVAKKFYAFQALEDTDWTIPETTYHTAPKTEDFSAAWSGPQYFTENKPTAVAAKNGVSQGTTSYIIIKGQVTPAVMINKTLSRVKINGKNNWDGPDKWYSNTNWQTGSTFWRIRKPDGTWAKAKVQKNTGDGRNETVDMEGFFCEDPTGGAAMQNGADGFGGKVVKFENAICYYRVWLTDNLSGTPVDDPYYHAVRRNSWFQVNMTDVLGIGDSTEDGSGEGETPVEPDQPVEQTQSLKVSIEVEDWEIINQNSPLG